MVSRWRNPTGPGCDSTTLVARPAARACAHGAGVAASCSIPTFNLSKRRSTVSIHLVRAYSLQQHIANGDWYPRWFSEHYGSYGYPCPQLLCTGDAIT